VLLAISAAASFGISGVLLKPMMTAGWSPTAVVIARSVIASIILAVPAALTLWGRWRVLRQGWVPIVAIGVVGVAVSQLSYAQAVRTLPIGTAILIQYNAPVLLVIYGWVATRRPPRPSTIVGTVVALAGVFAVTVPTIDGALDLGGVLWACLAAVTVAAYYDAAARVPGTVPALAAVTCGQIIGAAFLLLAGIFGVSNIDMSVADASLGGVVLPWWVPICTVGVVSTALGYCASISASRRLGARVASFFGLLEVIVAMLAAWIVLGEAPRPIQSIGGCLVVVGVAVIGLQRPDRAATL